MRMRKSKSSLRAANISNLLSGHATAIVIFFWAGPDIYALIAGCLLGGWIIANGTTIRELMRMFPTDTNHPYEIRLSPSENEET